MKHNLPGPGELFGKLASSASWWRRFYETHDAEEIHQIVTELSSSDLVSLDQRARAWSEYGYYTLQNWRSLQPSDVGRLAQSKYASSLLGLASFHHGGYVREAAVEELTRLETGKELPFLLIRLNDWVSQVREKAAAAISARLKPDYAEYFLANIGLVSRLYQCGRGSHQLADDICRWLRRPEWKDLLLAGMTSKDRTVRRMSFRLAAEMDPVTRMTIFRTALASSDAMTRAWAARRFLAEITTDELSRIMETLLKDGFMPVRRDALWAVATRLPNQAGEALREALLNSHTSMRETARQFLPLAKVPDLRALYLEAVRQVPERERYAAICGLGESGQPPDAKLLRTYLDSPLPKLRRAAVNAIGKLDDGENLEKLVVALTDPVPSVSREALKVLRRKVNQIPFEKLEQMLAVGNGFHVRRNAFALILLAGKWRKLPALLNACTEDDARLSALALKAVQDWLFNYNRSFAEPTQEDCRKIYSSLEKAEAKLPNGVAKEVRNCLKIYFK